MAIFQTRPEVVEAFQWTGGPEQKEDPAWIRARIEDGTVSFCKSDLDVPLMVFRSPSGLSVAEPGDYVIRKESGSIYPMQKKQFEDRHQLISDEAASGEITLTEDEYFLFTLERDPFTPKKHKTIHEMFYNAGVNPEDPLLMIRHNKDGTMTFFRGGISDE